MMEGNDVIQKELYDELLKSVFQMLEVQALGNVTCPVQGQTTINFLQETNKGLLLIRFNPLIKTKLETGHPMFEIESLCFFERNGIVVPKLLKFKDKFYFETEKWIICAYFCLPGVPVQRPELSVDLAVKIGEFLSKVIKVSVNYPSESSYEEPFIDTFNYVIEKAATKEKSLLELQNHEMWNTMKIATKTNQNILQGTPVGIVHADYFYENILKDQKGNIVGLLDFGDAYYGHILHDIAIGAMECSIFEDELWNLEIFRAFLQPISPFLISNFICFKQFYETLKLNCFRFGIYTLSNSLLQVPSINCNIYVNRYKKLLSKSFEEEIYKIFSELFCSDNSFVVVRK